jgi:hypothetical protein
MIPGATNSAMNAIANLKEELDKEKVAWFEAQVKVDVLTRAVKDLKISADRMPPRSLLLRTRLAIWKAR